MKAFFMAGVLTSRSRRGLDVINNNINNGCIQSVLAIIYDSSGGDFWGHIMLTKDTVPILQSGYIQYHSLNSVSALSSQEHTNKKWQVTSKHSTVTKRNKVHFIVWFTVGGLMTLGMELVHTYGLQHGTVCSRGFQSGRRASTGGLPNY